MAIPPDKGRLHREPAEHYARSDKNAQGGREKKNGRTKSRRILSASRRHERLGVPGGSGKPGYATPGAR